MARKKTPHAVPKKPERRKRTQSSLRQRILSRLVVVFVAVVALFATGVLEWGVISDWWPFGGSSQQAITDPEAPLAEFYSREVLRWREQINDWAGTYTVNPNVVAIVMQIESCGNPQAISPAGALGLMQVMPFHFENGENMLNPDVNVGRGLMVFKECLTQFAGYDIGLALACYNGGPSVTQRDYETWAAETQAYYRWATGLWGDVRSGDDESATLQEWLAAGGSRLCTSAAGVPISAVWRADAAPVS